MTKADKVRSATVQNRIVKTVVYCILTVYAFILLFPFYIILISALRPSMESYNVPFLYYIREFDVTGFVEIFTVDIYGISFVRSFFNTLLYVIPPTVVGLLVSVTVQILQKSGRDEQATFVTLAGVIIVMLMLVSKIGELFGSIRSTFGL